jgi:hypothetical protein
LPQVQQPDSGIPDADVVSQQVKAIDESDEPAFRFTSVGLRDESWLLNR